jgi:hypothetical protein
VRVLIAIGLPMAGAATVAGTYLDREILLCAGWVAVAVTAFLFAQPVIGIALMTGAFLMAAYPTMLQALGALTVNNLLGVCLLALMVIELMETRNFSFLRNRQLQLLAVIGVFLGAGTIHSWDLFPTLQATVGKLRTLDKSSAMGHDFVARLIYLLFFIVFVRNRRDIHIVFITFMLALYIAIPSALYNMMTGDLKRGFRLQASVTAGANPNRLAMIALMEVTCWWFWARSKPGLVRQLIALGVMATSTMVVFGTGSRSGFLGIGVLAVLLQTSQKTYRLPTAQIGLLGAAAVFAILVVVPPEAVQRMITLNPTQGENGATSNEMREETVWRAVETFQDYPTLGIGIGNFREVSRQVYQDPFYRPPHNSYLWAAAECGIFVLILYLVLFWITWNDLAVVNRLAYRDPQIGAEAGAIRVLFLLYGFFSIFADLWLNPITYAMVGLIITMRRYFESLPDPAPVRVVEPIRTQGLAAA